MALGRSRRGGGSAPSHCKTRLRSCMVGSVARSGNLRATARGCMTDFNNCRSSGRKSRKRRRRGRR